MKYLDKVANVAVIIGVAVFLMLVIRGGLWRHQPTLHSQTDLVGATITLPQAGFRRNTVLLAISTSCHFCRESMPFYRSLLASSQGKADVIAVLPQPLADANKFLSAEGVPVTKVISTSLANLGIYATPTVLMVDADGKVKRAWTGLLDERAQGQVILQMKQ
jgi:hypothetical protein